MAAIQGIAEGACSTAAWGIGRFSMGAESADGAALRKEARESGFGRTGSIKFGSVGLVGVDRDENGRKRSENPSTVFYFYI